MRLNSSGGLMRFFGKSALRPLTVKPVITFKVSGLQTPPAVGIVRHYYSASRKCLRVLLGDDFRWKKPPKSPLSGGL